MKFFIKWVVAGLVPICIAQAQTQEEAPQAPAGSDPDVTTVESMLEKNVPEGTLKVELSKQGETKPPSTVDYSQFKTEKSFHDTVIIQKNYMPKTKRVQVFGGLTYAANDVFSKTLGGQFRAGYHVNETWGVEATVFYLTSQDSPEKKDLADVQLIGVQDLITPKSFLGVNAYFSSIYGKMALEDRKIIPFEVYQTVGVGQLNTTPSSNATAFFFGFGNLFSISKNSAIRADLSWFFYNGKTTTGGNMSANTIFVTIGYGRMMPDARTR
jgi:outer membrane beta-barrel protein